MHQKNKSTLKTQEKKNQGGHTWEGSKDSTNKQVLKGHPSSRVSCGGSSIWRNPLEDRLWSFLTSPWWRREFTRWEMHGACSAHPFSAEPVFLKGAWLLVCQPHPLPCPRPPAPGSCLGLEAETVGRARCSGRVSVSVFLSPGSYAETLVPSERECGGGTFGTSLGLN